MENFQLRPISALKGKNFFIPDYQRGYKWEKEQVSDLLNDIDDFMNADPELVGETYCIQPLVVGYADDEATLLANAKKADSIPELQSLLSNRRLEVIDGQQRLTTIFLILSALGENKPANYFYTLEYASRSDSWEYLKSLSLADRQEWVNAKKDKNEDYFHMHEAYKVITEWLDKKHNADNTFAENYSLTLRTRVKFIWYQSMDPNPVQVFRRLNDGKIGLTDAELIKAFILHCDTPSYKVTFNRAHEWDTFETQLQDEEFWLFIQNDTSYRKPTRIEWLFDLIRKNDYLHLSELKNDYQSALGNDNHQTFRYFDLYIRLDKENGLEKCSKKIWSIAKSFMAALTEWYSDNELYHYVGYCIHQNIPLFNLYTTWMEPNMTKSGFTRHLRKLIKNRISLCNDLSKIYQQKRECLPLLLLHNIEEVLSQNRNLRNEQRFGMGAFYRFPFHLYKKEEKKGSRNGWEIEHIASNAGDADDAKQRAYFLESAKVAISDKTLLEEINQYNVLADEDGNKFSELRQKITSYLKEEEWSEDNKNKVWNYTLLDSGTNQEYHNAVFPFKRLYVINKEAGIKTTMEFDAHSGQARIDTTQRAVSFIPPITKKIFTKAFSVAPKSLSSWTLDDAGIYLLDLELKTESYLPEIYSMLRKKLDTAAFLDAIPQFDPKKLKEMLEKDTFGTSHLQTPHQS